MTSNAMSSTRADASPAGVRPTSAQLKYLKRGLEQPGGKLPLFDEQGQRVGDKTVRACIRAGWAEPWFANPMKPGWVICKITDAGRGMIGGDMSSGPAV